MSKLKNKTSIYKLLLDIYGQYKYNRYSIRKFLIHVWMDFKDKHAEIHISHGILSCGSNW